MAAKKGGLGRGLESLFAESSATPSAKPSSLPIAEIEPDKNQPRKHFEPESLSELAESIRQHGVLQPITVRPNPAGGYRIIAGERRWRAAREAGCTEIPAIIKEVGDEDAMELALIENLQREDLNPVEEAFGYRQLIDSCGLTQEQAASRLSKSRPAVANALRLLGLPQEALHLLREGKISAGHARAALTLEDSKAQMDAIRVMIAQGMNVRQAEALCKKMAKPKRERRQQPRPALPGEVELSLQEVLGTEVDVRYKDGKGTLQLHFYNDEQLKAFANLLGKYEKEKKD